MKKVTIFIYYDPLGKVTRVINTSDKFDGSVGKLVEALTDSDNERKVKNYHHFEVI
jgi:hypothetical protein